MKKKTFTNKEKCFYIEKKRSYFSFRLLVFLVTILITLILSYKYNEIKYLIALIFLLPVIKNTINFINTIYRYLVLHTYFPLSNDELSNILNIADYENFIISAFKFKPLPKTMKVIKEIAYKKFQCSSFDIELYFEDLTIYIFINLGIIFTYLGGVSMIYQKNFLNISSGIIIFFIDIFIIKDY